jgi:hypothetical protein
MVGNVHMDNFHQEMKISVDPFELTENAIDNLPEDISVSVRVLWDKFLEDMKKYTDVPFDLDPTGRGD